MANENNDKKEKERWERIRKEASEIVSAIAVKGEEIRTKWKALLDGLLEDAIKSIFKVENNNPSLLSRIFGIFGGKKANETKENTSTPAKAENTAKAAEPDKVKETGKSADKDKTTESSGEKRKWEKIREELSVLTTDIFVKGANIKDKWKVLLDGLKTDAIKKIFGVENDTPSLLSRIFGIFGSKSKSFEDLVKLPVISFNTGGAGAKQNSKLGSTLGFLGSIVNLFSHHNGGAVTKRPQLIQQDGMVKPDIKEDEVIRKLKVGERVLTVDSNKAFETFMRTGTDVVPYLKNPALAKNSSMSLQVQQSEKHIQELQRQNELMIQQNQMIFQLVTDGSNGQTTVAQPIVMQQQMSMDELAAMLNKMKRYGYRY